MQIKVLYIRLQNFIDKNLISFYLLGIEHKKRAYYSSLILVYVSIKSI